MTTISSTLKQNLYLAQKPILISLKNHFRAKMYMQDNLEEKTERAGHDFIKRALMRTIEDHPNFKLDTQTISSLDILPKLKADGLPDNSTISFSRTNTTVYAVLNKCRTMSGQRLLALWLQYPLMSKESIDNRLDIVDYFANNSEMRSVCYDESLKKIPDLLKIAFRVQKKTCSIKDLVSMYEVNKAAQTLVSTYLHIESTSGRESVKAVSELFEWIRDASHRLASFSQLLEESLVLDRTDEFNEYMLKPMINDDIAKMTDEIDTLIKKARSELKRVAYDVNLEADKSIKLEIDADNGLDFKVTKQQEQQIRGNDKYTQSRIIKKDGYRFRTETLTYLSNKYVGTRREYKMMAADLFREIIEKACVFFDDVLELAMTYTVLDVFVGLSVAATTNNYVRPLILDSEAGKIEMERLRHPCIENQPDIDNYVPNDVMMNKHEKKFYIVTGPNMGGKSTYIKSLAIGVIMAQCGSLIPADVGKVSIVDGVHTRVGAGDRQAEGVSTFMEEMMDMEGILKKASENSVVIIDELGRGTSTFDGFGLAWALTKHLVTNVKCYGAFATHFHEMTELETVASIAGNLHVKAHCEDNKLSMLFNVEPGICDESYGINVAKYTKFPEHVVKTAQEKLRQFEEVPGFSNKQEVRTFVKEVVEELTQN